MGRHLRWFDCDIATLPVWLIGTQSRARRRLLMVPHTSARKYPVSSSPRPWPAPAAPVKRCSMSSRARLRSRCLSSATNTVSPLSDATNVLSPLTHSPRKELMMMTSSQIARRSDPCEGISAHGYLGIDGAVVQRISDWIRTVGGRWLLEATKHSRPLAHTNLPRAALRLPFILYFRVSPRLPLHVWGCVRPPQARGTTWS